MEEVLESIDVAVTHLSSDIDAIAQKLGDKPVNKNLRDKFQSAYAYREMYEAAVEQRDLEKIVEAAKNLAVYGSLLGIAVSKMGEDASEAIPYAKNLSAKSRELRTIAENNPLTLKPLTGATAPRDLDLQTQNAIQALAQRRTRQLAEEIDRQEVRIQSLHKELLDRFQPLDTHLSQLDELAAKQIKKIEDAYSTATTTLEVKQKEVDAILGVISGTAVAAGYEQSAVTEKQMADWLRYASLACMFLIVGLLAYTFWETTKDTFSWDKSTFRLLAAVFLSAPAAYLARESSKHRYQQYTHLQTSLDLKAVSPYVASLPDEVQHKIKAELASRVFSSKDSYKQTDNEFPLNAQEIMVKVIDKVDFNRGDKKE